MWAGNAKTKILYTGNVIEMNNIYEFKKWIFITSILCFGGLLTGALITHKSLAQEPPIIKREIPHLMAIAISEIWRNCPNGSDYAMITNPAKKETRQQIAVAGGGQLKQYFWHRSREEWVAVIWWWGRTHTCRNLINCHKMMETQAQRQTANDKRWKNWKRIFAILAAVAC